MGQNVRPASGRLGVQIPAVTDLNRENRSTAKRSASGECYGSSEMNIINGFPVSQ